MNRRFLKALLLPPACLLLVAAGGLCLVAIDVNPAGLLVTALGVGGLWVASLRVVSGRLLRTLDRAPALELANLPQAQAIVVLDGGGRSGAREYGGEDLEPATLERLRYGAVLQRVTGLPLLVSGDGAGAHMAKVLESELGTPVAWVDAHSRDTHENARNAAALLAPEGLRQVFLVTHFWHLPRALAAFTRAGLDPLPAPMGFGGGPRGPRRFVPSARALEETYLACHEWAGLLWYHVRHGRPARRV